jgi:phosphoribosylamine--glycine ligase
MVPYFDEKHAPLFQDYRRMNILVIGSGGREHALCLKLAESPLADRLFCAPGNGGIAAVATCVALDPLKFDQVIAFCRTEKIDFVIVGPEAPLVAGVVEALEAAGIRTFGPTSQAAALEGSKGFTKDLCARHDIPTAAYRRFTEARGAHAYVNEHGAPIVVKADGLAAGKGVVVAMTADEAHEAIDRILGGAFGAAGAELVIEDYLDGEEISFFALCDGKTAIPLASAQDHKRVFDGDKGPNTGGMGAYSPAPVMTPALEREVMDRIVMPTVRAMAAEGRPFTGILFAGLMITAKGPSLIEFNTRFGDPECQVLMVRLRSDLLTALVAARDGVLASFDLRWKDDAALCVVMAANGYPGDVKKGEPIRGLDKAAQVEGVAVLHAGTTRDADGTIRSNGGRVLGVTASAATVKTARERAYKAVDLIDWPGGFCRRDIAWRAMAREEK